MFSEKIVNSLTVIIPKLRTPLQLSGFAVLIAVIAISHLLQQLNTPTQICAGSIGVCMIIFGQIFAYIDKIPEDRRERFIVLMFIIFCLLMLSLIIATGIFIKLGSPFNISSLLNEANQEYENRNYASALGRFQTVLSVYPQNLNAIYGKAKCQIELGERDSAMETIIQGLAITPEHNSERQLRRAELLNLRGIIKKHSGEYKSALIDFNNGIDLLEKLHIKNKNKALAALYGNCADAYDFLGQQEKAIMSAKNAINYDKDADWEQGEMEDLFNLATYYKNNKEWEASLKTLDKCMIFAKRLQDNEVTARIYWVKANLIFSQDQKEIEKSKDYFEKALQQLDNHSNDRLKARIYGDYGQMLIDSNSNVEQGKKKLIIALAINVKIKDKTGIGSQLSSFADLFTSQNMVDEALICGSITELCFEEGGSKEIQDWSYKFNSFKKMQGFQDYSIRSIPAKKLVQRISSFTGLSESDSNRILELCSCF